MSLGELKTEYEGEDRNGIPVWSCRRDGGGLVAYGTSGREAMQNFVELEEEVVPQRSYLTGFCQFEQPETVVERPPYSYDD